MIPFHLSVMGNFVWCVLPPVTMHEYMPPPPQPPLPPFVPAVESPTAVMWPPGFALQQNKLSTTVTHKFQFIMLDGHDCGYMIPHVTIPPNNLKLTLIIPFSSRKALFAASTVRANGAGIGCSQLLPNPWPMNACASPTGIPCAYPPTNVANNVTAGMTPADVIAGIVVFAVSAVFDIATYKPSSLGSALKDLLGFPDPKKIALGVVLGAAKILITGEGSITIGLGSSYAGFSVSYTRTIDGADQVSIEGHIGTPAGSISGSATHTENAPDAQGNETSSNETSSTTAGPFDKSTETSKTTTNDKTGAQESESSVVNSGSPEFDVGSTDSKTTTTDAAGNTKTSNERFGPPLATPELGAPL
jgi:hypothetical protein